MLRSGTYSVCFTDLRESTGLRVRLGDGAFDDLRRRHDDLLAEAIVAVGGEVVKLMGDGVLAVFAGAVDALDSAVAMQQGIDRLNRSLSTPLGLSIGLSSGDVAVERGDIHGTPVVEAARLCAVARAGQILASDVVRVLAGSRSSHRVEPFGDLTLKGLPEPLRTVDVVWTPLADDDASCRRRWCAPEVAALWRSDFVGRGAEYEQLVSLWKTASGDTTTCALVAGEAGIGKSRLAIELARTANDEGATVLFGGCDDAAGVAFQPWSRALGAYSAGIEVETLASELGPLGAELTRIVPALPARLPNIGVPLLADPESDRLRLFEAVTEFLGAIGREAPILVVLDDLHWADAPSLLLLRHVLRSSVTKRLMVVATYRDTELARTHPLSPMLSDLRRTDAASVRRVSLTGLGADDVSEFVRYASAHELDTQGEQLARAVHAETNGNPFFVAEMLRHLVASGAVVHDGDRWSLTADIESVGLPEGIRELIGRRLSALSDRTNEVLSVAAVAGPRFDVSVIAAAMKADVDEVLDACDEATRARLLTEGTTPGAYTFSHALVRQTLEAELTAARRTRWHRAIGLALEGTANVHVGELARHFGACATLGEAERALRYLRAAAREAERTLAFEEAVALYASAVEVAELIGEPAGLMCDLVTARGAVMRQSGDAAHREVLLGAVVLAAGDGHRLAAIAAALNPGNVMGTFAGVDHEVIAVADAALGALGSEDSVDRARMLALIGVELALAHDIDANERGRAAFREAIDMARRLGDRRCLGDVLAGFYAGLHGPDTYDELPLIGEELYRLADELGDEHLRLAGNVALMFSCFEHGDLDLGLQICAQHAALAERVRSAFERWRASFVGDAVAILDRLELTNATETLEATAAMAVRSGLPDSLVQGIAISHRMQANHLTDPRHAFDHLDTMEAFAASLPALRLAWATAARLAAITGDIPRAQRDLEHNVAEDFEDYPRNFHWVSYLAVNAEVAALVGHVRACASARRLLQPLSGRYMWSGAGASPPVDLFLGMVTSALGDHTEALEYFDRAIAQCVRANQRRWLIETEVGYARALLANPAASAADRERALAMTAAAAERAHLAGAHGLAALARVGDAVIDPA